MVDKIKENDMKLPFIEAGEIVNTHGVRAALMKLTVKPIPKRFLNCSAMSLKRITNMTLLQVLLPICSDISLKKKESILK